MLDNISHPIVSPNLKGYQHIAGIWFPFIWFSEQLCANFILQYWFKGCLVYRFDQGYLLRFPYAIKGYCEQFEGWPLIESDHKLCSMRLSANEKQHIPSGDIILLLGNSFTALDYQQGEQIDPSIWIKIDDYSLLEVDEWAIESVELDYIDPTLDVKSMDEILGESSPKPSEALLKFIKENKQKKSKKQNIFKSSQSLEQVASSIPVALIVFFFLFFGNFVREANKSAFTSPSSIPLLGWISIIIILIGIVTILRRQKYLHTLFQNIRRPFINPTRTQSQAKSRSKSKTESTPATEEIGRAHV